jgi:N5-(carboxyethyl)ornithine synthase
MKALKTDTAISLTLNNMITAVFKTSLKENEKRIPIHPAHIERLDPKIIKELVFEKDYGVDYGYSDMQLETMGCKFAKREDLFHKAGILILPKPVAADLEQMLEGQILCGWTHAVQQRDIADLAIEKKLTLLAWEEMNHVTSTTKMHTFYRNNELAGYAGVLHYLQLLGQDGHYGERKKVVVFGYGSVSKGAIYALQGRGFNNITVYTQRPTHLVADKNPDVWYKNFNDDDFWEDLYSAHIIFNGVLQDVNNPLMFIRNENELAQLKRNAAIIDISCDKDMGFYFAQPTSFKEPLIKLSRGVQYYSVDHTPTYLWNSASREISAALVPHLKDIIDPERWESNSTIINCIDIYNGKIHNQNITKFQNR